MILRQHTFPHKITRYCLETPAVSAEVSVKPDASDVLHCVRFYVVFLSKSPLNFQDDVFAEGTLTSINAFSNSFRSIYYSIWSWFTASIFKQTKSAVSVDLHRDVPYCSHKQGTHILLNMELGKAYFSMELGISIIPAGEVCKWSRNCRLDDDRYTEV
jgi:hypothetical protein